MGATSISRAPSSAGPGATAGPHAKITPRFVYQKVEAGGFNREDHYIIFDNEFTSSGGTLDRREQYLLFREKFSDKTKLGEWFETVPDYLPYESGSEAKQKKVPR